MKAEIISNKLMKNNNLKLSKADNNENSELDLEYSKTMDFIHSLCRFGINLGLGRIRSLLERLGNPERSLKVVHIGGTNGIGSTSAFLAAILRAAGYRVGMYISPHLEDYRERMTINGEWISKADLFSVLKEIKPHLQDMVDSGTEHPTEFEISTVIAIMYFVRQEPDLVLMEVGLGGEIDSTNVVDPLVSVITSIGFDHMDYLGGTIEEIAKVKAGIIKKGVPVVTSVDKAEALAVLAKRAEKSHAELFRIGQDILWQQRGPQSFDYRGLQWQMNEVKAALLGRHQFVNASAAIAVCEILRERYGFVISEKDVCTGLQEVKWPCRLEVVSGKPKIVLDGAHNVDGMTALKNALESELRETVFARKRLIICLGMLADKEREKAAEIICPLADQVIITKPDSPRAGNWRDLGKVVAGIIGSDNVRYVEDPKFAITEGISLLDSDDMLLVTGSLYMLGEVRSYLRNIV
jgi:dihydrofolate synthase/folylpolyglutamate synthase